MFIVVPSLPCWTCESQNLTGARRAPSHVDQIAEKEREKKAVIRADPVDARAPSLEEKIRFTYNLYKAKKNEVRMGLTRQGRAGHAMAAQGSGGIGSPLA